MDSKLAQKLLNLTRRLNNAANALEAGPTYGLPNVLRQLAQDALGAANEAQHLSDRAKDYENAAHSLARDLAISTRT